MLAEVFDPRNSKGKRHPLKSILGFLVVGFMCGHKGLQSHRTQKIHYGITSLSPEEASAERLLSLRRGHWSIGNKSHWMRDTLLGKNTSPVRCGAIPQVMAAFQNTALSVFRFTEATRIADMMKYYASNPKLAVNIIK